MIHSPASAPTSLDPADGDDDDNYDDEDDDVDDYGDIYDTHCTAPPPHLFLNLY